MAKKSKIPAKKWVYANIEKFKIIKGVSDKELAEVLEITNYASRRKSCFANIDDLEKIADYFGIKISQLFEKSDGDYL